MSSDSPLDLAKRADEVGLDIKVESKMSPEAAQHAREMEFLVYKTGIAGVFAVAALLAAVVFMFPEQRALAIQGLVGLTAGTGGFWAGKRTK